MRDGAALVVFRHGWLCILEIWYKYFSSPPSPILPCFFSMMIEFGWIEDSKVIDANREEVINRPPEEDGNEDGNVLRVSLVSDGC